MSSRVSNPKKIAATAPTNIHRLFEPDQRRTNKRIPMATSEVPISSTCGYKSEPKPMLLNGRSRAPTMPGIQRFFFFTPLSEKETIINRAPAEARIKCCMPRNMMKFKGALAMSRKNWEIRRGVRSMCVAYSEEPHASPMPGGC